MHVEISNLLPIAVRNRLVARLGKPCRASYISSRSTINARLAGETFLGRIAAYCLYHLKKVVLSRMSTPRTQQPSLCHVCLNSEQGTRPRGGVTQYQVFPSPPTIRYSRAQLCRRSERHLHSPPMHASARSYL